MKRGSAKQLIIILVITLSWHAGLFLPITVQSGQTVPYRILKEPSTHTAGKVQMEIFVDFYCPHCHRFETEVLPILTREFGTKLEVKEVGFPVIRNKPRLPFELYEAARGEGRGDAMARILFRVLQEEHLDILDPSVEKRVIIEAGMKPEVMQKWLAFGEPRRSLEEGISRGHRYGVESTPTVVLDGYVLTEGPTAANLRTLVQELLSGDRLSTVNF